MNKALHLTLSEHDTYIYVCSLHHGSLHRSKVILKVESHWLPYHLPAWGWHFSLLVKVRIAYPEFKNLAMI